MNKMITILILGFVLGSSLSTDSDRTVLEDMTAKNPNYMVDGTELKDCKFVRTYIIKEATVNNADYSHVYFHCTECLDANLVKVGETDIRFNYGYGGNSPTPVLKLPPGCPITPVERKPTVCENGVKLGKHIVSDVTEILTKEMVSNPLSVLAPSDRPELNPEEVTKVTVELESLEAKLQELLNAPHDNVDNGDAPDSTEQFPNNVVKRVYTFPNTTVEVLSRPLEEGTQPRVLGVGDNLEHEGLNVGPVGETGVYADNMNGLGPEQTVPGETMAPENPADLSPGMYHTKTVTLVPNPENPNEYVEEIIVETLVDATKPRSRTKTWTRNLVDEPVGTVDSQTQDEVFPDGTVKKPDGSVVSPDGSVTKPDGTTQHPDGTVTDPNGVTTNPTTGETVETPETPVGSNGKPVPHGEPTNPPMFQRYVEKIPVPGTDNREHTELVQVRGSPGDQPPTPVPTSINFSMPPAPEHPFTVPADLFTDVDTVSKDFVESLTQVVANRSECLLDKIFHEKEYQIELVCAKSTSDDERNSILENHLVRDLFCNNGNCNEFLEGVIEQMVAHNLANTGEEFKIESQTYKSGILPGSGSA